MGSLHAPARRPPLRLRQCIRSLRLPSLRLVVESETDNVWCGCSRPRSSSRRRVGRRTRPDHAPPLLQGHRLELLSRGRLLDELAMPQSLLWRVGEPAEIVWDGDGLERVDGALRRVLLLLMAREVGLSEGRWLVGEVVERGGFGWCGLRLGGGGGGKESGGVHGVGGGARRGRRLVARDGSRSRTSGCLPCSGRRVG